MLISKAMRFFIAVLMLAVLLPQSARAQTVIRDTEIEEYMAEWFAPIYAAAGMSPDQVKIIIVQDSQVNAFVAGGSNIFFYTGLLQKTSNPGEVIGVMAHELGHITGGHLIRGREAMERASYESILGMIIGMGAAIASGDGGAAATVGAASSSMAQRGFLKHTRTFESSADQAALRYFAAAHLNPSGFETFLKKLEGQELLPETQQSEYVRSHPLTRSRVDTVGARVDQSPDKDKPWPDKWNKQHKMMLAKLAGFISPQQVVWTYDDRDNSAEALTARAVAAYRMNQVDKALKLSDQLLKLEPNNPYFLELKGQMLMDFGRVAQAVPFYEKAVANKPDAGLIRIALAHAQVESAGNDTAKLKKAIDNLKVAQKSEPRTPRVHRLLATAYGRSGDETRAKLHLAEEALLQNKFDYAKSQATAASKGLKQGTSDWIRANDIINYVQTHKDQEADS
jgi:predicted Zn-dependent protease